MFAQTTARRPTIPRNLAVVAQVSVVIVHVKDVDVYVSTVIVHINVVCVYVNTVILYVKAEFVHVKLVDANAITVVVMPSVV